MSLKNLISSPLEAGTSVLDAHRLPSHVEAALEYTARRLARKALTIDLVVIRRAYQLPVATDAPLRASSASSASSSSTSTSPCSLSSPPPPAPATASMPAWPSTSASAFRATDDDNDDNDNNDDDDDDGAPGHVPPEATINTSPILSSSSSFPSVSTAPHTQLPSFPSLAPPPPPPPPASRSRFTSAFKSLVRAGTLPNIISPHSFSFSSHSPASSSSPAAFSPTLSSASSASHSTISSSSSSSSSFTSVFSASPTDGAVPAKRTRPRRSGSTNNNAAIPTTTTTTTDLDRCQQQPGGPFRPLPARRATSTTASTALTSVATTTFPGDAAAFGIRLVHADDLPPRHEKMLQHALTKAARKFQLSPNWLAAASALGLPGDLVRRSREQNRVLFAAPGLVLRAPDHLYTFKAALCSYAATGDRYRLEDAVDELRRYVLARRGREQQQHHHHHLHLHQQQQRRPPRLAKRELLREYPSLTGFAETHLADVSRMYSRAYGGPEHECGIEADGLSSSPPVVFPHAVAAGVPAGVPAAAMVTALSTQPRYSGESERSDTRETDDAGEASDADSDDLGSFVHFIDAEDEDNLGSVGAEHNDNDNENDNEDGEDDESDEHDENELATPTAPSAAHAGALAWPVFPSLAGPPTPSLARAEAELAKALNMSLPADDEPAVQQQQQDYEETAQEQPESPILGRIGSVPAPIALVLEAAEPAASGTETAAASASVPASCMDATSVLVEPHDASHHAGEKAKESADAAIARPPVAAVVVVPVTPLANMGTLAPASPKAPTSPTAQKIPVLKLQTSFAAVAVPRPQTQAQVQAQDGNDEQDGQLTARPVSCVRTTNGGGGSFFWGNGSSIGAVLQQQQQQDEATAPGLRGSTATLLSPVSVLSPVAGPDAAGPLPPTTYDDISPITRSEWGFLMGDQLGRQVTVTTF
ncbi:hypothetical protein SPI_06712 [Niveomyces insectorum RCEF 264]|uniref:DUF7582 domain-containing protein n=1 Tax=Niveomyces insectorum RCEF 264 TaxID=1081102 RepID=A0A167RIR3_9HYPO|nr:hypothetical protein SPI_06712 [Niveomyces insectorum RCEF 264]